MSSANPELSIVIPAYNEEALLPATLESLKQALKPAGIRHEIIVCDNNSSDSTAATALSHGARVVFEPHNQISRARNTGARSTLGDWLLFIDADTRISPPLARCMLDAMRSLRTGAGGAPVCFDSNHLDLAPHLFLTLWNSVSRIGKLAAGSFVFCRKQAWEECGGFDESYYAGEEIFFSHKLKQWCRRHHLDFRILPVFVHTSARKLQWHSPSRVWGSVLQAALPGAIKDRKRCSFWYERPGTNPPAP